MTILGFDEHISGGTTRLRWICESPDQYVRRLYIPKNPNYESIRLVSLAFGKVKYAPAGAPLEFFSVEVGLDRNGPGQPLDEPSTSNSWIFMNVGQAIEMVLSLDPIYGTITLRGMFVVKDATAFQLVKMSEPGASFVGSEDGGDTTT